MIIKSSLIRLVVLCTEIRPRDLWFSMKILYDDSYRLQHTVLRTRIIKINFLWRLTKQRKHKCIGLQCGLFYKFLPFINLYHEKTFNERFVIMIIRSWEVFIANCVYLTFLLIFLQLIGEPRTFCFYSWELYGKSNVLFKLEVSIYFEIIFKSSSK